MITAHKKYTHEKLLLLKRAKLKQLETQLQYQQKNKKNTKEIHQTMKDIQNIKKEISNLNS